MDIISIDLYDNGSGGYFTSDNAAWQQYGLGFYDAATGRVQGMRGVLDFARAHGKKTALDEWGATNKTLSASNGANNDFFIPAVYDFLMANKEDIEYEVYFNFHVGNRGRHQIYPPVGYNPRPSAAYLSRWRP